MLENAHGYTQTLTEIIVGTDLERYIFNLYRIGFVALREESYSHIKLTMSTEQ